MATTNISTEIVSITGVAAHAASDDFIVSAQKFVVASIPKELLMFALNRSSISSDGSAMTFENDSIVDVQRNGYSCKEILFSESVWATDSGSLKKATSSFPVYWIQNDGVKIAPATDGSNGGYVFYINSPEIDDDCDLRNAVINYSASKEFSKLSSDEFPTISIKSVTPDVPKLSTISFSESNALNITASVPSTPSDPAISSPGVATVAKADISGDVPTYTKPGHPAQVAFNDFFESGSLNPFDDSDPSEFNVTAVSPDTPKLGSTSVTITGVAPVYTAPAITTTGSDSTSVDLTKLDTATWTDLDYDFDDENIDPLKWFQVAGDLIQNEEDTELAQVQLQKISTYIQAYSTAMQNQLNKFNDANIEFQAILQKDLKDADFDNQEDARLLQKYQAELGIYQAEVGTEVQEYTQKLQRYTSELNTAYQAWTKTESDNLQVYQMDIQNELNDFNEKNARYQANVQASISKFQADAAEAQKEGDLTLQADIQDYSQELALFNGEIQIYQAEVSKEVQEYTTQLQSDIQTMQGLIAENQSLLNKYQAENAVYQAEVQSEVAEYQNKLGKQKSYSQEADLYYKWAQSEISLYIQNNSKMIALSMASQSQQQSQQRAG